MRRTTDAGAILILVACSIVVLFGIAALSIDGSHAYDIRSRLGMAADRAAKAGAIEIWRGNSTGWGNFAYQAVDDAKARGAIPTNTTAIVRLCSDVGATCTAPYQTDEYVEVILSSLYPTFFGTFVSQLTLTPTARAVAGTGNSPDCLITLAPTDPSLEIGQSTISVPGCSVSSAGSIEGTNPGSEIDGNSVSVAGGCSGTCSKFDNLAINQPPPTDPLAGKVPVPASCTPVHLTQTGGTISPGCYGNLDLNANVTMLPGVYTVSGIFHLDNNTQVTTGMNQAFMYFGPGASFDFEQNTSLTITAPIGGPYNGIAVFIDPGNTNQWVMNNSSMINVTGAFYAPSTEVYFNNHMSATSTCTLFVVGELHVNNGDGLFSNQCGAYGGSPITSVALAE